MQIRQVTDVSSGSPLMFANYRGKLEMKITEEQLHSAYDALEQIIGQTTVADGITTAEKENGWRRVMEELTRLSIEDARKMGEGLHVDKGNYKLLPEQWVHARFLAVILDLSAWMGKQWESHGLGRKQDFLQLVERAYDDGQKF